MSTLKEILNDRRASGSLSDKACLPSEASAPGLLVYDDSGDIWILPWSHLVSARYTGNEEAERLTLLFSSHVVELRGLRLAPILPDIAAFRLDSLRSLPAKYEAQAGVTDAFIEAVSVRPIGAAEAAGIGISPK